MHALEHLRRFLREAALAELHKEAESDKELSLFVKSFMLLNAA